MRIARQDIPVRIDVPGAVARQKMDFGCIWMKIRVYWSLI